MKWLALLLAITGCKHGSGQGGGATDVVEHHGALADDAEPAPSYGRAEIQHALAAERAAEEVAVHKIDEIEAGGDVDELRVARADLAVRRRFIAMLEHCDANGHFCPPRLDEVPWDYPVDAETDPKLDAPLRFDLESWRKVADELHGRACACRSLTCVESLGAAIDRLESRPMPEVQGDDDATTSITRARDCLFRLRGKRGLPRLASE